MYGYKSPFVQVDVHIRPKKLLCEQGNIETVGIITSQVAPLDLGRQGLRDRLEGRAILDILVRDPVNRCRLGRNGHLRIDPVSLDGLLAVRHDLYVRQFHDPVFDNVDSGRFQVEKYQGIL